jgi:collagen type III alpha
LPVGSAIQVTGEENHLPAILQYLNSDGECWIHATLHQVVEEGSRSSKTLAEVRIDGNTVGRLTPKMSSDLLPAVSYLAELGQATCVRAIVKGNRLKAEVVLYALRAHELPADWFNALAVVQGVPVASEGALTPVDLRNVGEPAQPQAPSTAETPTPPPMPPADWYADPHHVARLRYWDGAQWTEHMAP